MKRLWDKTEIDLIHKKLVYSPQGFRIGYMVAMTKLFIDFSGKKISIALSNSLANLETWICMMSARVNHIWKQITIELPKVDKYFIDHNESLSLMFLFYGFQYIVMEASSRRFVVVYILRPTKRDTMVFSWKLCRYLSILVRDLWSICSLCILGRR